MIIQYYLIVLNLMPNFMRKFVNLEEQLIWHMNYLRKNWRIGKLLKKK